MKVFHSILSFLCLIGIIVNVIVLATGAGDEPAVNIIAICLCSMGCLFNFLIYLEDKDPKPTYVLEDD